MSFNGSGTFQINTAGQPVVSGTTISSTAFNALTADLATGLSTCITKDGQTTPTANIPMGNNKITGLAVGTVATDAATLSQVQSTAAKLLNSVSGVDTITAAGTPSVSAYAAGQMFYFVAAGDNTGAVTINIDSLGAKSVTRDGAVALAAGDIKNGEVVVIVYDGTRFQVVSQLNSSGDARFANVSITSALYVGGVATIVGASNFSASVSVASTLAVGGVATIVGNANFNANVSIASALSIGGVATFTVNPVLTGGTANGVVYLNASKAATTGTALTYNGTTFTSGAHTLSTGVLTVPAGAVGTPSITTSGDTNTGVFFPAADTIAFAEGGAESTRLDSSGNLLNGLTTASFNGTDQGIQISRSAVGAALRITKSTSNFDITNDGAGLYLFLRDDNPIIFGTNNAQRARITNAGTLLVGKTTDTTNANGVTLSPSGFGRFAATEETVLAVNRISNDGTIVSIQQDATEEGSISVSGNTVSYNAFAGSHWSQLQDGSKPDILRGTVMESINELCVWPNEVNERLPKAKISDTAGSKKVYGVFMAWDNDWTVTNDMLVTAVGAFICRVNGSVTVQEGDLLESNGDGTARVQSDDIIRSSTIGKVTSTVKTHQYADGSYCVPTVLYCG